MLWRLPGALREVLVSKLQRGSRAYSTARPGPQETAAAAEPLRILFCGSDAFSIASLRALHAAQQDTPGFIEAIHVVHRPPKPTGRGLKTLREVPLAPYAASLPLPTHPLNTFTAWTPPFTYNLIIAVSFGLLIPPRILSLAPLGGLNVHPSLLPDLRGSAPIPHAILKGRERTGVSVQTLHPHKFDAGRVLAQSAAPGVVIGEGEGRAELEGRLAVLGAEMLVDVLRTRRYLDPAGDEAGGGWFPGAPSLAPKITKLDHFVDFATMDRRRVMAGIRALGSVWCVLPNGERLVVHEVRALDGDDAVDDAVKGEQTGLWVREGSDELLFRAKCGKVGVVASSTYPGGKKGGGNAKVVGMLRAVQGKL